MYMLVVDGKFVNNFWTVECVGKYLDDNAISLDRCSIVGFGA